MRLPEAGNLEYPLKTEPGSESAFAQGAEDDDAAYGERHDGGERGNRDYRRIEMKEVGEYRYQGDEHAKAI